jgi:hypothetical protein
MITNDNLSITIDNKTAIDQLLSIMNGKATKHTFTFAEQIIPIAKEAEDRIVQLGLPKSRRKDAIFTAISGSPVAKSYDAKRIANRIKMLRKKDHWVLVSVEKITIYPNQGGSRKLIVTKSQADYLIEKFSSQFCISDSLS